MKADNASAGECKRCGASVRNNPCCGYGQAKASDAAALREALAVERAGHKETRGKLESCRVALAAVAKTHNSIRYANAPTWLHGVWIALETCDE